MRVCLIPLGHVSTVVPQLIPHLERICAIHDKYNVDYWLAQIYNGSYSLWGLMDGENLEGILLSHFRLYPKRKVVFFTGAATEPHVWASYEEEIFDVVTRWGKDNQCSGVEFEGRPGWKKPMFDRGFEIDNVTYSMQFGDSDA